MGRLSKSFGRVVPAAILDAGREAARLRADATREVEGMRAEARQAAESLRLAAAAEGAAAGAEAARAELDRVLSAALRESERVRRAALPAARKLAVRMAEKVIGHAVSLEPALLDAMAERALAAAAPRAGKVVVRLHPDDYARLAAAPPRPPGVPSLARRAREGGTNLELWMVADPAVDRFGCIVDTASGRLDARVATQLAVLEEAAFPSPAPVEETTAPTTSRPR